MVSKLLIQDDSRIPPDKTKSSISHTIQISAVAIYGRFWGTLLVLTASVKRQATVLTETGIGKKSVRLHGGSRKSRVAIQRQGLPMVESIKNEIIRADKVSATHGHLTKLLLNTLTKTRELPSYAQPPIGYVRFIYIRTHIYIGCTSPT